MKWFFELGNQYAKKSNWKDFALTKFCLFAMGLLVGVHVNPKYKKETTILAGTAFAVTYVPLIGKVLRVARDMGGKNDDEL